MIETISWAIIKQVWTDYLWVERKSPIEPNSAMNFLNGYSLYNLTTQPTFFGYYICGILAGVNSGHMCDGNQYRSRGLYVFNKYRGNGIGVKLLLAAIEQANVEDASMIWSLPRKTSWNTYSRVGFMLSSDWFKTETSDSNAYCSLKIK